MNAKQDAKTKKNQQKNHATVKNVFEKDSDDDDNNDARGNASLDGDDDDMMMKKQHGGSRKSIVNRDIVAEQIALRKRAELAMKQVQDRNPDIYEYDGVYDTVHKKEKEEGEDNTKDDTASRKSRYVQDLLEASKKRQYERDIIYDRKKILEQEKELAAENANKKEEEAEKFITPSYKRQLMERELWNQEQKQREEDEMKNDIAQTTKSNVNQMIKMNTFYGNTILKNNNTLTKKKQEERKNNDDSSHHDNDDNDNEKEKGNRQNQIKEQNDIEDDNNDGDHIDRNQKSSKRGQLQDEDEEQQQATMEIDDDLEDGTTTRENINDIKTIRLLRQQKIEQIRERFFQRHLNNAISS